MCDQMRRLGVLITEFNFGGHCEDPGYRNEGTRMWYQAAQKIRENMIVCPPYHQPEVKRLFSQLSSRGQKSDDLDSRLSMESKAEMRSRGVAFRARGDNPDNSGSGVWSIGSRANRVAKSSLPTLWC
jgi:hypothetical protein